MWLLRSLCALRKFSGSGAYKRKSSNLFSRRCPADIRTEPVSRLFSFCGCCVFSTIPTPSENDQRTINVSIWHGFCVEPLRNRSGVPPLDGARLDVVP